MKTIRKLGDRQLETDVADSYRAQQTKFERPDVYGWCCLPVLHWLWGRPWNNMAENYLMSLRPSCIRVTLGEIKSDAKPWRVTVYLEKDERTIVCIDQEVEVGLTGCENGNDIWKHTLSCVENHL